MHLESGEAWHLRICVGALFLSAFDLKVFQFPSKPEQLGLWLNLFRSCMHMNPTCVFAFVGFFSPPLQCTFQINR